MSARQARFEVVRTDVGWHARFRAANGRIVMSSEVYVDRRAAVRAVELIVGAPISGSPFAAHPEVDWQGDMEYPTEVRDIDERTAR